MVGSIRIFLGILVAFATNIPSFGQLSEFKSNPEYRFTISTGLSLQSYFDNNPMIETDRLNQIGKGSYNNGWLLGTIGDVYGVLNSSPIFFRIDAQLADHWEISAVLQSIFSYHHEKCFQCGKSGQILIREQYLPHIIAKREIMEIRQSSISVHLGAEYRYGWESAIINYGAFDVHLLNRTLRDAGLIAGLSIHHDIAKNRIRLAASATYSEFIYRYDQGQRSNYNWDNGSTRRMISYFFTAGYRIVKIEEKTKR